MILLPLIPRIALPIYTAFISSAERKEKNR